MGYEGASAVCGVLLKKQPERDVLIDYRIEGVYVLGTVLYAFCAVSVLQETGCSVRVEDAQVFWTIDACRKQIHHTYLKKQCL